MSYQNESFGMMDPGYFVPRGEIITWINDLLKVSPSLSAAEHHQNLNAWIRRNLLPNC